jgi:anti-sigma-K factor RskA
MTTGSNEELDDISALLPWYAAGTLDARSALRVEAALAERPELRATLRIVEQEREQTIELNQALGAPSPEVWARILEFAQGQPRKPTLAMRLASFTALFGLGEALNRRRLAWSGAAAALVIVLQGGAILSLLPAHDGARPHVASGPSTPFSGVEFLISFAPDARIDQIDEFLHARHASIVDGPRAGVFRVRVGQTREGKNEIDALIQDLSGSPIVRMALPVTNP